jgi:hypothetical protein
MLRAVSPAGDLHKTALAIADGRLRGTSPTTLQALAELARRSDQENENPFRLLTAEKRRAIAQVLGEVATARSAQAKDETLRQAAAASLLVRLVESAPRRARDVASHAAWKALQGLLQETDPRVVAHALAALYSNRDDLAPDIRRAVVRMVKERIASSGKATPPYEAWDRGGVRTVRFLLQCQDEFYPAWQAFIEGPMGFELVSQEEDRRIYRRVANVDGKRTESTLTLVQRDGRMFDSMGDPNLDVVIWCGHSNWFARVADELRGAPAQQGAKVLLNFMCFGENFLRDILTRYADAHVVTTDQPTEDEEDQAAFQHILEGFEHGSDWAPIARKVSQDERNPDDNFRFPIDLPDIQENFDDDDDGIDNSRDTMFEPFPAEVMGRRPSALDITPQEPSGPRSGRPVFEAALLENGFTYDNELLDTVNIDQLVRPNGFFHAAKGDERVVELKHQVVAGQPIVRLRVSDRYSHSHPAVLYALSLFEATLGLLGKVRKLSAADRVLMAIAMVGHASDDNTRYPYGPTVFKLVLEHYGLPSLRRRSVLNAVEANKNWESGSRDTLADLRQRLTPAQLEAIESRAPQILKKLDLK